ncbi:MAG: DUF2764 family protein [Fulvivirga sp.]
MSYYYLIAGLPDLEPGMDTRKIDFKGVVATIQRNLAPRDERQFRYLLYPNDNRNLLNTLWHKYKSFPNLEHVHFCTLKDETLQDYHRQKSVFPPYIGEFLSIYEDQFPNMSPREMEDRLLDGFYEEAKKQSPFIKEYFKFEKRLKEILAAYNASCYNFLSPPSAIDESILGQVGKGKSVTPGFLREYPYIETLGEKVDTKQPEELEKFIDHIKWDYLQEVKDHFSGEQVFAYTLKLQLVLNERLSTLDRGAPHFQELQKTIKSKIQSPIISTT